MNSQVGKLHKRNQSAVRLSQDISKDDELKLLNGSIRYVFASPEALDEGRWKSILLKPSFSLAIKAVFCDEAHCVEVWGGGVFPFRQSYSKLASLQSFFTSTVPFVALTATASTSTRLKICKSLNMIEPVIITTSPNRINLRYSVIHVEESIVSRFTWLLEELRMEQSNATRTVVFCRSIASCASLYRLFDFTLKDEGYVPRGVINVKNALFGMFHSKITDYEQSALLESFSKPDGVCRILFSTIAFGMGLNIPNIYRVIHDGPAESVDHYVQESGRGGRDGHLCEVVLYLYSGSTRGKISSEMKMYCKNKKCCRRIQLMECFPGHIEFPQPAHMCCDICATECLCNCTCGICHCTTENSPCSECCTCVNRCTHVPTSTITSEEGASQLMYESTSESDEESPKSDSS